ncbi:alpha-hydroxy-acid oxidizing protein [Bradyrhizobium sp. CCGUVB1N3]|uniref:alpha-hydroxy acid oxidase n=1 Tax=Bradyrhizobium sp. CCGUVB1N3 TaxID=2949629 RepID=UPI0020B27C0C|nr:alpha-hydroxy acid oxidase [Bradyrhizobium sp. CCGUVB1N3]MCP3473326.1 alpha-hydroxy-acid oxidizing protein [Bradyrhizobium sp. CCGUVB1N3]
MEHSNDERTIAGLFGLAARRLRPEVWDYFVGGSETETTIARNRMALDSREFLPRVLRDVSKLSIERPFFDRIASLPIFLAPIGSLGLFDPEAALACAKAAANAGVPMFLSIMAQPSLEDVARLSPKTDLVLQLYMRGDRNWLDGIVGRAEGAGCVALCMTVDSAVYGRRERDLSNGFSSAAAVDRVNFADRHDVQITREQAALTWDTIGWLRRRTAMPLILKGIMTADDAALCVENGVDVVYISNHGGRQLDHTSATLDQLQVVAQATAGRCKIFIDGGFLHGTDVLKAIALGADFVGIGKAQAAGLAANGAAGVSRLLTILHDEIATSLALLGCPGLADLGPDYLRQAAPIASNPLTQRTALRTRRTAAPTEEVWNDEEY